MSSRLPRLRASEILAALRRDGWEEVNRGGSHVQLKHPQKVGRVTVPFHSGRTIALGTLKSILTQAGLTAADLEKLL
jgi:predicted RNA binding protein YcfA (HicA-like mRNA interferase family)